MYLPPNKNAPDSYPFIGLYFERIIEIQLLKLEITTRDNGGGRELSPLYSP